MTKNTITASRIHRLAPIAFACLCFALSGCGGGEQAEATANNPTPSASLFALGDVSPTEIALAAESGAADAGAALAEPYFHAAPGLLTEPDDDDAAMNDSSSRRPGAVHRMASDPSERSTRKLTPSAMRGARMHASRHRGASPSLPEPAIDPMAAPMAAAPMAVTTYSPAQIRAAYGMHALPPLGTAPSASQAATMGAGQTIYIVNAHHNPNAAAELAAFNAKFGLPACSAKSISPTASLPLASAPKTGCEFSVVYSTAAGAMTTAAPSYNSGWATETALDVQWAHATAPYARIVLIEAPDASVGSLTNAVRLANSMGQGAVSMSFGAAEGSWGPSYDSTFTGSGMSYFAATGDNGASVSWPSSSANVVAVGGTSLSYSGVGTRSETVWSGTGGGVSSFVAKPTYQSATVPGLGTPAKRSVADVAFNANPNTGQYVATIAPGATAPSWISAGGTSLSTPQWAGISAAANAVRALAAKPTLGAPNPTLYGSIATVPGTYAASFLDVSSGTNGTCSGCGGKSGYDIPTGLGTPHVASLVTSLGGSASSTAPVPPSMATATISGVVGTPLAFTLNATGANALSYSMSGAPAGMSLAATGVVNWSAPVAGTYKVIFTATDTVTKLASSATYTVAIAAKPASTAPTVASATIAGSPSVALSYKVQATSANALTFALTGAPAGMAIDATGNITWSKPVAGTYSVSVKATDTKTALSSSATLTFKIAAAGPVISTATLTGKPGATLTGTIAITDSSAITSMSYRISGIPMGMRFSASGLNLIVYWPGAVAGSYNLTITATDSLGQTAQAIVPVIIK